MDSRNHSATRVADVNLLTVSWNEDLPMMVASVTLQAGASDDPRVGTISLLAVVDTRHVDQIFLTKSGDHQVGMVVLTTLVTKSDVQLVHPLKVGQGTSGGRLADTMISFEGVTSTMTMRTLSVMVGKSGGHRGDKNDIDAEVLRHDERT